MPLDSTLVVLSCLSSSLYQIRLLNHVYYIYSVVKYHVISGMEYDYLDKKKYYENRETRTPRLEFRLMMKAHGVLLFFSLRVLIKGIRRKLIFQQVFMHKGLLKSTSLHFFSILRPSLAPK